ncbi:MAG: hypothetical protein ACTSYA_08135 [Candidatus Kariarchaeaceae archaeon]
MKIEREGKKQIGQKIVNSWGEFLPSKLFREVKREVMKELISKPEEINQREILLISLGKVVRKHKKRKN